ncbi:MAG: hypothetical protein QM706_08985 [Nitrospira sp.]
MRRLPLFVGLILAALLSVDSSAEATCSGSGLAWKCTAGSTVAQVNSALSSAPADATITFDTGAYDWRTGALQLNNSGTKGVTLICATVRGCTATYGAGGVLYKDFIAGTSGLVRLSGFIFTGSPGTAAIWLYGGGVMSQIRIDNNTFQGQSAGSIAILLGETSSLGRFFGVIDHNIFTGPSNFMAFKNLSGGNAWVTGQQGGGNAMFFEDNQCTFSSYTDTGTGCVDDWRANSTVLRFNTLTNSRFVNHSYCHGGPYNSEIYGNRISNAAFSGAPNYRNIHFQGSGEEMAWGNQVEDNGNALVVQHFRSDPSTATNEGSCNSLADGTQAIDGNRSPVTTYRGYPAWHQPGRDEAATLKPLYLWRNRTAAGAFVPLRLNSGGYMSNQFRANRDYYEAVSNNAQISPTSPFNGTTGMGYGTLANRPTTCTATPEPLDAGQGGVGYWATDQGTWKKATPGQGVDVENGVLYRCSSTNTWTVHYTPYTYPHPLVTAGGSATPMDAPTNLRVQ